MWACLAPAPPAASLPADVPCASSLPALPCSSLCASSSSPPASPVRWIGEARVKRIQPGSTARQLARRTKDEYVFVAKSIDEATVRGVAVQLVGRPQLQRIASLRRVHVVVTNDLAPCAPVRGEVVGPGEQIPMSLGLRNEVGLSHEPDPPSIRCESSRPRSSLQRTGSRLSRLPLFSGRALLVQVPFLVGLACRFQVSREAHQLRMPVVLDVEWVVKRAG